MASGTRPEITRADCGVSPVHIVIIGAGAIGCFFGALLMEAGNAVTFVARGPTLEALRTRGLRVESPRGDRLLTDIRATPNPSEAGPADLVIVAVKTWQLDSVLDSIRAVLGPRSLVLPLLNGVGAAEILTRALGREAVLNGMCRVIVERIGPAHVRHRGVDPFIAFGRPDNLRTERLIAVQEMFAKAGIASDIPSDIRVPIWMKFLFIAPVGGVGACTGYPMGKMRSDPESRDLITRAMREIYSIACAKGIPLSSRAVEKTLASLDAVPDESTTSMQRDLMEGRPSELDQQTGAVVRAGRSLGVPTPVNEMIYERLLPLEQAARRKAAGEAQP
jgi:2-dehydropantoate 2-reductase